MKILKNRFIIGALCIVAAMLLSFIALPAVQGGGQGTYTTTVRMKEDVQGGTQISADMVETVEVPDGLIQGGISDVSLVVGRYANADLFAGDYLTGEKLSASPEKRNALASGTPKGKKVVSVTLPSLAAGVSGRLLPGDVVTVIALQKSSVNQTLGVQPNTTTADADSGAFIYPELRYLEVCMVTTVDGSDAVVSSEPSGDGKNSLPVTVSFFVDEAQALRLAELEQQGIIHLAFIARGEAASEYIPDAQRVFGTEVD